MMRFSLLFIAALILIGISFTFQKSTEGKLRISLSESPTELDAKGSKTRKKIYIFKQKTWLSSVKVKELLDQSSKAKRMVLFSTSKVENFSASAPGMNSKHHIVNAYLVGYAPFNTNNIWVPWKTLAKRKRYLEDYKHAKKGYSEVWQSSRQAFKYPYGDCEDHSIALADWLINMGVDARVVIGKLGNSGHAWVVMLHKGKQYLLESTQKEGVTNLRHLPLAVLQEGYYPEYMFNRTTFWKNTGSLLTTNYTSSKWEKMSKYMK